MKLTWTSLGLALVAQATFLAPLGAQPVSLTGTSTGLALSRQTLFGSTESIPAQTPLIFDASLVLASAAHLTTIDDPDITATAAARPTLGFTPESTAATPSNIDRFLAVSLGRLDIAPALSNRTTNSVLAAPTASLLASPPAATSPNNVRLISQLAPATSRTPAVNLPRSGASNLDSNVATGVRVPLGRGTIVGGGGNLNAVGIPEPSTYLLCGGVLILGGYWHFRRRANTTVAAPTNDAVNLQTVTFETGESLSK